jgi:hypothetical protein
MNTLCTPAQREILVIMSSGIKCKGFGGDVLAAENGTFYALQQFEDACRAQVTSQY